MDKEQAGAQVFGFFNEIGIVSQLASALFTRLIPLGLHLSHFIVLNHLARLGDGRTPLQIANALQVTKATMTHTLAVLGRHGQHSDVQCCKEFLTLGHGERSHGRVNAPATPGYSR